MTKKQLKEKNSKKRVVFNMNLGTITHKSIKDYNRQISKANIKKEWDNEKS